MMWAKTLLIVFGAVCWIAAPAAAQPSDGEAAASEYPGDADFAGPRPPRDDDDHRGPPRRFDHKGPPPGPPHDGFRGPGGPGHHPGPPGGFGPGGPGGPHGPGHGPHGDWESMEKSDPEMFKLLEKEQQLDHQSRDLAQQYRRAPTDQQPAIKQKLEAAVTAHFEARQARRLVELKRLEDELKRLRESIDRRNKAQATIVGDRVSSLLGLEDGF